MSYADEVFVKNCKDILSYGTDTKGQAVRPHWKDGESAYTIKRFGVVNHYEPGLEFPALTLRKTAIKSAMDEILWIYQKKSNNVHDLATHIWDAWQMRVVQSVRLMVIRSVRDISIISTKKVKAWNSLRNILPL